MRARVRTERNGLFLPRIVSPSRLACRLLVVAEHPTTRHPPRRSKNHAFRNVSRKNFHHPSAAADRGRLPRQGCWCWPVLAWAFSWRPAGCRPRKAKPSAANAKLLQTTVDKAIAFLAAKQGADGSLSPRVGIGPTTLATLGLLRNGRTTADPQVAKGLAYLTHFVQADGGIYPPHSFVTNYETCLALVCFQAANGDHRYDKIIGRADAFVRGIQIGEKQGKTPADLPYGGVGYGARSRPDLSNTAFLVDALKANGAKADDEAIQRRWSSCRAARTWKANTTRRRLPTRSTTAASTTPARWASRTKNASFPTAACAATAP